MLAVCFVAGTCLFIVLFLYCVFGFDCYCLFATGCCFDLGLFASGVLLVFIV